MEAHVSRRKIRRTDPPRQPPTGGALSDDRGRTMYIARVRLENVRGFFDDRNVDLDLRRPDGSYAGWTVIAGQNGSGKTSLLRAAALAASGPAVARSLVPDFESWITTGRDAGTADVELVHDQAFDRTAEAGEQLPSAPFWVGIRWTAPAPDSGGRRGPQPSLHRHDIASTPKEVPRQGPWQDNPTGWFCAAYGPFRRLAGGSGDSKRIMRSPGPAARLGTLFHEDASLAEGVSWLIEQHLRSLEDRPGASDLKHAAIAILRDGLLPDGYSVQTVDSDGLWVENAGRRFPLRDMSDGYRTVAALVVDMLKQIHEAYGELTTDVDGSTPRITAPGVVIIDEVDAHLHVSWQKRIGWWLKRHFPNIQFIVTTHSPYICQSADQGGLIRLPRANQLEPPMVVDQDLYERIIYGSGDDAVLSDLFGLDTPYSDDARELRRELVELEFTVMTGKATHDQQRRYAHLADVLTSSPVARTEEVAARLNDRNPPS
ncbi:AAA family ATPase [Dactylosporangium sp. NPDC051541]|uniref:AAA family ATPase n=1 Tax=Dactylosporangium sp. NPDC051541 TaxID=3363977 RepID=UPI0037A03B9F